MPVGRYHAAASRSCSPADRSGKRPAWLNDVTRYHNRGDIDFSAAAPACFEQGDFFGLDDLFTEQPAVVTGLAAGVRRLDRALQGRRVPGRHREARRRAFFPSWVPKIRAAARAAGVKDFEIFGEVFVTDAIELSAFSATAASRTCSTSRSRTRSSGYAGGSAGAKGIASRLDDDDYFLGPSGRCRRPGRSSGTTTSGASRA